MKKFTKNQIISFLMIFSFVLLSGCFFILAVNQPSTAGESETITVTVEVEMNETDYGVGGGGGPSAGITAMLIPVDWTVESVSFDDDYGPEDMVYLHTDSIDVQPAKGTDFWYDSLAAYYPADTGMHWVVYQGLETYLSTGDTASHVTFTYEFTTGAAGVFELGYMVSTADLGFQETHYRDVSLGHSITVGTTAIEDIQSGVVKEFALRQNFPNPFNPTTKIKYEIKNNSQVNLTVYDLTGKEVATLVNSFQSAGIHEVNFDAANLPSGIYIYKLNAGSFSEMRKMALVK